jgi:triacylglycerol esterase/lipase EstA (alpha/beta hydrolase family)
MHPIVLTHGFFGFEKMAGIEYFRKVRKYLKSRFPDLEVIIPEVSPNDLIEQRAAQLWTQIDKLNKKVHIIGHSMGGLDSRFLLSPNGLNKSERVKSLTTLFSPHWGSPVADFIIDQSKQFVDIGIDQIVERVPSVNRALNKVMKSLRQKGEVSRYLLELFNFSTKGMTNLTTHYMREFNDNVPNAPGTKYLSYAGVTGPHEKDYLPPVLYVTWAIVYLHKDQKAGGRNDGLVSVGSAKWGEFKGEEPADHFKVVGWDISGWGWFRKWLPCLRSYNHLKFFERVANDLRHLERD